ncbi:MAG: peptidoglycan-binding domain-containing protein [Polyangiales bacterium]
MSSVLKKGSRGDDVKALQESLNRFGYGLDADGIFGDGTDAAVRHLQKAFGYTVDGLVGEGTYKLIKQQLGYNWNKDNVG